MNTSVMAAAFAAALFLSSLARAQESTDTLQSKPAQARQTERTLPADTGYGGPPSSVNASGKPSSPNGIGSASTCAPRPFCNIYSGGQ